MNALPEFLARPLRLLTVIALLALAACGPGTGGTGTGPVSGILNFSGSGFAAGIPCPGQCVGTTLRLEDERVELNMACRRFVHTGAWEIDGDGVAVLDGTLETTRFTDGQPQTSSVAATMRLQFSEARADSREVVVALRDLAGNTLVAAQTLEQRPAASSPDACSPGG